MIYLNGHLARPLDAALSNGSRVAVLRVLRANEMGRSGREIARVAGINHQAAAQALAALAEPGVLERRAWGPKVLWRLDRRRWLVTEVLMPMLKKEAAYSVGVAAEIKTRLKGKADSIVIVGDEAKGRLGTEEPLEIVAVCEPGKRCPLIEAVRILEREIEERFGLALNVAIMTKREASSSLDFVLDGWQLLPTEGRPSIFAASAR